MPSNGELRGTDKAGAENMTHKIKKICKCGKEFEVWPYRKDKAKYCSLQCAELKKKIKETVKTRKFANWTKKSREKLRKYHLGKKLSTKTKEKMSEIKKGKLPKNIELLKHWNKGKKLPQRSEENAYQWKGDCVGYRALHHWVKRHKGEPTKCVFCGKEKTTPKSIHWANKSHQYKRDLTDWLQLCVNCHIRYDKNLC